MFLIFEMILSKKLNGQLIYGELKIKDSANKCVMHYTATSGLPEYQYAGSQIIRGKGPIPSCDQAKINQYKVATNSYYSAPSKSEFFHITPDPLINGIQRSEFGIHYDAGWPGSAGCIVLKNEKSFKNFQDFMSFYSMKHSHINLIVGYLTA